MKKKIIRITTIPLSLDIFCRGMLRELSDEYEVVAVSSPGPLLDEVSEREGVRTVAVPMQRRPAPLRDLVSLFRLAGLFRRERPDMVHSMTPKAGLLAMMAAKIARVPVRLHTFTGLVFPYVGGWRHALYKCTDRLTAACATHLIPEGEGVKADLISYGITKKPLEVLGYGNVRGIDLRHYDRTPEVMAEAESLRERFGIGPDTLTFIFVGRFDVDKGLRELIWAFTHLKDSFRNVHLLLAGGTEEGTPSLSPGLMDTMENCTSIHMSDRWVRDVRPWLAAADVLVHPSYREGFPNVVIEAGAMGLPSVVTDINGSREIISDGVNGLIVPPGSALSLYSAMKRFAESPSLSSELAGNARRMVAERYEQGYVRACLRAYYQSIMQ